MFRRRFLKNLAAGVVASGNSDRTLSYLSHPANTPERVSSFPLSVMLWTIEPKRSFEERISMVAQAGYHAIELVLENEYWSALDYSKARTALQSLGMAVDACDGIRSSLCDPSQRAVFLDEVRAKLPALAKLECSRLIVLTGNRVPGLKRDQMHASCVEGLKRAADIAAAQNVELLLENIDPEENPNYFLTSVVEGFDMIREVDHPRVRFLYDLYHEQISGGNLTAKLVKNIDLVGLIHVADVPGRHEPGTGEINYGNIFRKLGELQYSQYVAMEFLPVDDPVDTLRTAREFAEKHAAEGRGLAAKPPQ